MTDRQIVETYLTRGYRLVFWPATGEWKGPREKGWLEKALAGGYTLEGYKEGDRVGIVHGDETAGGYRVDLDVDWAPGANIARALLPPTRFMWGRRSKPLGHLYYVTPDLVPMYVYKDIGKDGATLLEFRSDKHQSMAPPSMWEKDGQREKLTAVDDREMTAVESASMLKQRACLAAIGMILAKHLGHNGFGHDPRLAWAGFLLRLGIPAEDLEVMGQAISTFCNNTEPDDVRRVLTSTSKNLAAGTKRVKGGPELAKLIGEGGKAVVARIKEWVGRDSDYVRNKSGIIIARHYGNVARALELLEHELSYNEFSEQMVIDGMPLEDRHVLRAYFELETEQGIQPPLDFFRDVVEDLAQKIRFNPVKQYLSTLKWDGMPRLDKWMITAARADDSPYVRTVSSIVLIAAVRRIREPGVKYDEMVVWESPQGMNKSTAVQALCPRPEWFSDDLRLNLHARELIEATLGKWIIEASDLAGKRKTEIEQLKATMSRQRDGPARMAYARVPVQRPRQFIIIGTTNSSSYLTDSTGGRRFWPVVVGRFDVEWIKTNRDQLWAEACEREAAGEPIRLPEDLWPDAEKEQEQRHEADPWEELLRSALAHVTPNEDGLRRVHTTVLWDVIGTPVERRDRYGAVRISEVMQRLGFERTVLRIDGIISRGYKQVGELEISRKPGEDDVPPF